LVEDIFVSGPPSQSIGAHFHISKLSRLSHFADVQAGDYRKESDKARGEVKSHRSTNKGRQKVKGPSGVILKALSAER
jgi:hypothetical protein